MPKSINWVESVKDKPSCVEKLPCLVMLTPTDCVKFQAKVGIGASVIVGNVVVLDRVVKVDSKAVVGAGVVVGVCAVCGVEVGAAVDVGAVVDEGADIVVVGDSVVDNASGGLMPAFTSVVLSVVHVWNSLMSMLMSTCT